MDILVVDDDAKMVESIGIGLESSGHCVVEALSAKQALDQLSLEGCKIGIVITDYLMPAMNGIDLLKAIKKKYPSMPVIIMTAYAEKNMVIEALKSGCDSIIEKPFGLDQLVAELERIKLNLLRKAASSDSHRLLPGLVHQINTPLSVISDSARWILLNRSSGNVLHQNANHILASVRQIKRIIKTSRLEEKRFHESIVTQVPCQSIGDQLNVGSDKSL